MSFVLIGVNHKTAPVEIRERLAIAESRIADVCREFVQQPGIKEAIVFSTRNRVELLASIADPDCDLRSIFLGHFAMPLSSISPYLYEYGTPKPFAICFA